MRKLFRLIVLVLFLGGWALAAASLHVVRDGEKIVVIPKQHLDYHETYVDTTKWTLDDVAKHPAVVTRLIQTGKLNVLQHIAPEADLEMAIQHAPQSVPTTQHSRQTV